MRPVSRLCSAVVVKLISTSGPPTSLPAATHSIWLVLLSSMRSFTMV